MLAAATRPTPRGPTCLSTRTPGARSRVEVLILTSPRGQRDSHADATTLPKALQSARSGLPRKAHVNTLPRFLTNSRASLPSHALPRRAIHAARDEHPHGPARPGQAGPGLRRWRETQGLRGRPTPALGQQGRTAPGPRSLGGAAAYLRGTGRVCEQLCRPSAASERPRASSTRQ